jgi:hypothetical protein
LYNAHKSALSEEIIYNQLVENNYEKLKYSFIKAEKHISSLKFDVNFSGSTGSMLIILGNLFIKFKEIE